MKKILISITLLLIGAALPAAAIIGHDYFYLPAYPINYEMVSFAFGCAIISLAPALVLAILFNLDDHPGIKWAFYASIIAHYTITLIVYSEGAGGEPMGLIFIPIMFVAPVSLVGGLIGFAGYLAWKRLTGQTNLK